MTELTDFLVALYDALSEAETEAFVHGRERFLELAEREEVPRDVSVPVYHAADLNVSLDVGVVAEETESGTEVRITDDTEDDSTVSFNAEVFDLIEKGDVQTIDYDDLVAAYPEEFPVVPDTGGSTIGGTEDTSGSVGETAEQQGDNEEQQADDRDEPENDRDDRDGKGENPTGESGRSVEGIEGIDRSSVDVLERSGIKTAADIIGRTPEDLREIVSEETPVSIDRVDDWIQAAATETASTGDEMLEQSVRSIDGIGPAYTERLAEAGVETVLDLIRADPDEMAAAVSTDDHSVSPESVEHWIEHGRKRILAAGTSPSETSDYDTEQ